MKRTLDNKCSSISLILVSSIKRTLSNKCNSVSLILVCLIEYTIISKDTLYTIMYDSSLSLIVFIRDERGTNTFHSCFLERSFALIYSNSFHAIKDEGTINKTISSVYCKTLKASSIPETIIKSNTTEKDARMLHALMINREADVSI